MEQVNIIKKKKKKEVKIWARIFYVYGQSGDPVNAAESDGFLGKKRGELYFSICNWLEICIKAKTRCIHLSISLSMNIRG